MSLYRKGTRELRYGCVKVTESEIPESITLQILLWLLTTITRYIAGESEMIWQLYSIQRRMMGETQADIICHIMSLNFNKMKPSDTVRNLEHESQESLITQSK